MLGQFPSVADRSQLVAESLGVGRNFGDGEVRGIESGKLSVTAAVVAVGCCIFGGNRAVEDAHADVAHSHRAELSVFKFQHACSCHQWVSIRVRIYGDALQDACTRRVPRIAHGDRYPVVSQFRHFKKTAQKQPLHFSITVLVYLRPESGQTAGEAVFAEDGAAEQREQETGAVGSIFAQEDFSGALPGMFL